MIARLAAALLLLAAFAHLRAQPVDHGGINIDLALSASLDADADRPTLLVTIDNPRNYPAVGRLTLTSPDDPNQPALDLPMDLPAEDARTWRISLSPADNPYTLILQASEYNQPVAQLTLDINPHVRWLAIGPFDNTGNAGLDALFPPETEFDPDARYPGKSGRTAIWQPLTLDDNAADLLALYGEPTHALAYARAVITAEHMQKAILRLGSDDDLKVFLNGEPIHEFAGSRTRAPGNDEVELLLRPGENILLLKVCQRNADWGFDLELTDDIGSPLEGVTLAARPALIPTTSADLTLLDVGDGSATFSWRTDQARRSTLILQPAEARFSPARLTEHHAPLATPIDAEDPVTIPSPIPANRHTLQAIALLPGTRYIAHVEDAILGSPSEHIAFVTPPAPGTHAFLTLKVAVLTLTNVTESPSVGEPGHDQPISDEHYQRIIDAVAANRIFYWVNSAMMLNLDLRFFRIDTPLASDPDAPYGLAFSGEEDNLLRAALEPHGLTPFDFDGLIIISADKRYEDGQWIFPESGGGTLGPLPPFHIGRSGWKAGSDNAWLFCHEFGHQLDALLHESGPAGEPFLFNHFNPADNTAHKHGEHWDGNAWILRHWAGSVSADHQDMTRWRAPAHPWRYLISQWGTVELAADADNDGFPDADPRVPLDERTFGSSPARADSDADNLPDLAEAMARTWVDHGHGVSWLLADKPVGAKPRLPDSDSDGLPDGSDPQPFLPAADAIPFAAPADSAPILEAKTDLLRTRLLASYDRDALTIIIDADRRPDSLRLLLDLDDDGFYVGTDNLELLAYPGRSVAPNDIWKRAGSDAAVVALFNAHHPSGQPAHDADSLPDNALSFVDSLDALDHPYYRWRGVITIPFDPRWSLDGSPGESIALCIALQPPTGSPDSRSTIPLSLLEPHRFLSLRLRQPDSAP